MSVKLRKRNQGGKTSLYLDYYSAGKRKTETLKLYLFPKPKTKLEREQNKKTLELAESKKAACWFICECLPINARTAPETGAIGIV